VLRLLLEQNPDSAQAHVLFGEALDGLGRTPEAITEFEAAAKISPSEPNVHFGLGYLRWKSQQYDEARQEFHRELALDPNHAQALAYLGDVEWKNNHPDAALPLLERAMKAKNDLRIGHGGLFAAPAITGRARLGAGGARPDVKAARGIDIGD